MKKIAAFAFFVGISAFADAECEKRFNDSKMMFHPEDARILCEPRPTRETQDCVIAILTQGKGKLQNKDLIEVYGACVGNSSQEMRDCAIAGLPKSWNDPAYKGFQKIGNACMKKLADKKLKELKEAAWGEQAEAAPEKAKKH